MKNTIKLNAHSAMAENDGLDATRTYVNTVCRTDTYKIFIFNDALQTLHTHTLCVALTHTLIKTKSY